MQSDQPLVKHRLGRFVSMVMSMTVMSRLFGFLRDMILAQIFGATADFDAFVIAFKIPNFMRRLFGEGAFSQAFIPVLAEYRIQHGVQGVRQLINRMTGVIGLMLLAIVVIGEIVAPLLVWLFAPGFSRNLQNYHLATQLIRITLPYLFSIGLVAVCGAVLNTYHRFGLTAFTPVLLNIVLIAVAVWWVPQVSPQRAVTVLAWGVALSGILQLIIQWPALQNLGLLPKPVIRWRDQGVQRVFRQLFPALLGVSVAQIGLLIDNCFASFLPAGSISWLYYSDRLIYFPLGIIGVTLSTVVMPQLSHQHHRSEQDQFRATIDWALRYIWVIAVPAALGLFLLAGPILDVLMRHGAFTAHDVEMSRRSLMAFSVGLPALMAIKIFAAAFYARHNTQIPARIAGCSVILNIILNAVLIVPLAHVGLALATALASWFNAVLLWFFLRQQGFRLQPGWARLGWGVVSGSVMMIAVLSGLLTAGVSQNAWHLLLLIGLGSGAYFCGAGLAGVRWRHLVFKVWN